MVQRQESEVVQAEVWWGDVRWYRVRRVRLFRLRSGSAGLLEGKKRW